MIRLIMYHLFMTLLLGAIALGYFFSETQVGLATLIQLIEQWTPGELHIQQTEGILFSSFSLQKIFYRGFGNEFYAESVSINWQPRLLLQGWLEINELKIDRLKIKSIGHSDKKSSFNLPLPLSVLHIAHFHITLQRGDVIGQLKLSFSPIMHWQLALKGNHIDPSQHWTDWSGDIHFVLNSLGDINNQRIDLSSLTGTLREYPIKGQLNIIIGPNNRLNIEKANLTIANSYLIATGKLNHQWNLRWKIHSPDLNTVLPESQGSFFSSGTITGTPATPNIMANFDGKQIRWKDIEMHNINGGIHFTLQPNTPFLIVLAGTDLKLKDYALKKINLKLDGNIQALKNYYFIMADITIPPLTGTTLKLSLPRTKTFSDSLTTNITGKLHFNLNNFSLLSDLTSFIKNPRGQLQGDIQLTGSLTHPNINAIFALEKGNVIIPKLGLTLKNIYLTMKGNSAGKLTYQGTFSANTGTANVVGKTELFQPSFPTEIHFRGTNLKILNLAEYKISASPDITLHFINQNLSLDGTVFIPEAIINPKDFSSTVTLPQEVVFVGQPQTTATSLLSLLPTLQLSVNLGEHIYVHYQSLDTTLAGNIQISASPNTLPTGSGELHALKGTYTAYGQTLAITRGRLIYAGNLLNNPGLDIKAARTLKTVTTANMNSFNNSGAFYTGNQQLMVGVEVLGTLNNPLITLFSEPSGLSQTDILSYMISGQPAGNSGPALLSALAALNAGPTGKSQVTSFTQSLQQRLGFSEFSIGSTQSFNTSTNSVESTTSVIVGKQLTNELSIHYSIGLFNPVSVLNLTYQFSKHWSLQSETSTIDNGADLIYSIERN